MRQEAHFRESLLFRGEWVDDVVFALLAREWRDRGVNDAGFAASR
jgi:RimJ/RimL family protein N-acetyltransferase